MRNLNVKGALQELVTVFARRFAVTLGTKTN